MTRQTFWSKHYNFYRVQFLMSIPHQWEANLPKEGEVVITWWRPGGGDGMSGVDGGLLAVDDNGRVRVLPRIRTGGWLPMVAVTCVSWLTLEKELGTSVSPSVMGTMTPLMQGYRKPGACLMRSRPRCASSAGVGVVPASAPLLRAGLRPPWPAAATRWAAP